MKVCRKKSLFNRLLKEAFFKKSPKGRTLLSYDLASYVTSMSLCIIFPSFHSVLSFSMFFVCLIDLRYCNNTFPFLSHLISRMTLSILLSNNAKTHQIEPGNAKKRWGSKKFGKMPHPRDKAQ